ncbi:hypothetical protein IWZ03DRAFT_36575 [Phyllosticta citriasiana]|uniref:Transmembrane protein n=1 Tax=Phyllosticta citriasiana TaxID=595635 RepID=A0ABR1L3R7_9PEZI
MKAKIVPNQRGSLEYRKLTGNSATQFSKRPLTSTPDYDSRSPSRVFRIDFPKVLDAAVSGCPRWPWTIDLANGPRRLVRRLLSYTVCLLVDDLPMNLRKGFFFFFFFFFFFLASKPNGSVLACEQHDAVRQAPSPQRKQGERSAKGGEKGLNDPSFPHAFFPSSRPSTELGHAWCSPA